MTRKLFPKSVVQGFGVLGLALGTASLSSQALAECAVGEACVTINLDLVDGSNGLQPIDATGFRWLVELDNSHSVTPGVSVNNSNALDNHASHAPVVEQGTCTSSPCTIEFPDRAADPNVPASYDKFKQHLEGQPAKSRYFVSVLPTTPSYTMGGVQVAAGQTDPARIVLRPTPIPTAQISIFVHQDNFPLNAAPDLPQEVGLCNFKIYLEEPAGRYGANGGQVQFDAWGNSLGTTYQRDVNGSYILDGDGNPIVETLGTGLLFSGCGPDDLGVVRIKNLPPAKYGVRAEAPQGSGWQQTHTIEGSPVIDAWVKADEPPFFTEFGPPGHHVFIGFTKAFTDTDVLNGGFTVSGQVHNAHHSRPPEIAFNDGGPYHEFNSASRCWVGLNSDGGTGRTVAVQRCDADSRFSFANVPPGNYQLAIFDDNNDIVMGYHNVIVANDGTCGVNALPCSDLGAVPVFNWFGRLESTVFYDANENGYPDPGEPNLGADILASNIRFRDGSLYQTFAIDTEGVAPFDQVFPFFHWMVAEIDPGANLKTTGMTAIVDAGGPVDPGDILRAQPQSYWNGANYVPIINPNTGDEYSRTEVGEVLLQNVQTFLGTTNRIYWGKKNFAFGTTGGILGTVVYATTRAENDPEGSAWDTWEPGVPRVQVDLYRDDINNTTLAAGADGIPDDLDGTAQVRSDVDNWPFGNFPGTEDIDHNGNGTFDPGDAIMLTRTDSWDDNQPTGCPSNAGFPGSPIVAGQQNPFHIHGDPARLPENDCFEGLRTFNQVRNGVFDGGYAINGYVEGGLAAAGITWGTDPLAALAAFTETAPAAYKTNLLYSPNVPGFKFYRDFIVAASAPRGYRHVTAFDKNVDFGQSYVPGTQALPPGCVGEAYTVSAGDVLELFPSENVNVDPGVVGTQHLCDMKTINLSVSQNAGADFHVFTDVPRAGRLVGFILNDFAQEFDPTSPAFGEKYAPSWIPFTIRDYAGSVIYRGYSDEFGKYNALVPSTYSANAPNPSGFSPNMLTACLNDPGPIDRDPVTGAAYPSPRTDPFWLRQYTQFCYTFEYMPGVTTYLDTPVQPVAAFTNTLDYPLDCECDDGTPAIHNAYSNDAAGPFVLNAGSVVTLMSQGDVPVPNPAFVSGGTEPRNIDRDFGFGDVAEGAITVTFGDVALDPTYVNHVDRNMVQLTVPAGTPDGSYPVQITRANGKSTKAGITVHVGTGGHQVHIVQPTTDPDATPIQDAIDLASAGDLILVTPGTYEEHVIVYKNVRIQGAGEGSTFINAVRGAGQRVQRWREKVQALYDLGVFDVVAPQAPDFNLPNNEGGVFSTEEGAAFLVVGKNGFTYAGGLLDGMTIQGSDNGGGIVVNGFGGDLTITNNVIRNNTGVYGGGIRIGNPEFIEDPANDNIRINHNRLVENGANIIGGGGVAVFRGTDTYVVDQNRICGNFTVGNGGGMSHIGLSQNGMITRNEILFNQSFDQGTVEHGGGLFIGGQQPAGAVTEGSGSVIVDRNLIQGNQAGAGDGGAIRLQYVNGTDALGGGAGHSIGIFNNVMVNNVTGMAGAVSMQDAVNVLLVHNTITNNDATATTGAAFAAGNPVSMISDRQPAGVVSYTNSVPGLNAAGYSDPVMVNNIIRHNRAFYWAATEVIPSAQFVVGGLLPDLTIDPPVYEDLAVIGDSTACLNPLNSVLGSANVVDRNGCTYDGSNVVSDAAMFVAEYSNAGTGNFTPNEPGNAIQAVPALDEGGNFIEVRFGPLTLNDPTTLQPFSNYHLDTAAVPPAIDAGLDMVSLPPYGELGSDFDGDIRPQGSGPDIGADETASGGPVACVPAPGVTQELGHADDANLPHGLNGIDEDCNGLDLTFVYQAAQLRPNNQLRVRVTTDYDDYADTDYAGQGVTETITYGNGSQVTFPLNWSNSQQRWQRNTNNFVNSYGVPTQIAVTGPEGTMYTPVDGVANTIQIIRAQLNNAETLFIWSTSDYRDKALLQAEVTYFSQENDEGQVTVVFPMSYNTARNRWQRVINNFVDQYGPVISIRVFGPEGSITEPNIAVARALAPRLARN